MRDLVGKRVAVTGSTGFVGRHVLRRLVESGAEVFALSRRSAHSAQAEKFRRSAHFLRMDLAQPDMVRTTIAKINPEVVIHAATDRTERDWRQLVSVNVTGTMALLEACARIGGLRLITFGASLEMLDTPTSAYGASRRAAAEMLLHHARAWSVSLVHIRTGNVFGPGMPRHKLIPSAIQAGLAGTRLKVAPDGIRRNYLQVDDLVDASLAALRYPAQDVTIVNAVSSKVHSAREVCEIVAECLGRPVRVEPSEELVRAWDRFDWAKDAGMAEENLGWRARVTLADGIAAMVKQELEVSEHVAH